MPSSPPPPSVRLSALVKVRPAGCSWPFATRATLCMGVPVLVDWGVGDIAAGLMATIGTFTALYGSDRPHLNRAVYLAVIAASFALAVTPGVWAAGTAFHGFIWPWGRSACWSSPVDRSHGRPIWPARLSRPEYRNGRRPWRRHKRSRFVEVVGRSGKALLAECGSEVFLQTVTEWAIGGEFARRIIVGPDLGSRKKLFDNWKFYVAKKN